MAIKMILDSLDAVPEDMRDSYQKGDDGKFHLQLPGMVDKKKLEEFRDNNRSLQSQLDEVTKRLDVFKDLDVDEYKEMQEQQRKLKEKELIEKGEIDQIVSERIRPVIEAKEAELEDLRSKYEGANQKLGVLLIDDVTADLGTKHGVADTALRDLKMRARDQFKIKDGKPVALDSEGNPVYGADGITPLSLDKSWVEGVKKEAPHLFRPAQGSGAEQPRSNRPGAADYSKLSGAQKIAAAYKEQDSGG